MEITQDMFERLAARLRRVKVARESLYFLFSDRLRSGIPDEHWVKREFDAMKSLEGRNLPCQFFKIVPDGPVNNYGFAGKRVIHGSSQKFKFVFSKASQAIEMSELITTRAR